MRIVYYESPDLIERKRGCGGKKSDGHRKREGNKKRGDTKGSKIDATFRRERGKKMESLAISKGSICKNHIEKKVKRDSER